MEERFVADAMLGRLAKWLRILGYDTLYNARWQDADLVRIARAEERLLLTRDGGLARRRGVRVCFLQSEDLRDQLAQLLGEVTRHPSQPFTRCPVCNEPLEPVSKDLAWGQVPPYVFVTQEVFHLCAECNRFYWRGTHWMSMCAAIRTQGAGE